MSGGIVFWVIISIVVGFLASTYNRSGFGWFLVSLLISPIIAGILLLLVGKNNEVETIENIEKIKQAQQDYISLCCANEGLLNSNPVLAQKFIEICNLSVDRNTTITVEDIDKHIQMLLQEVVRAETQSDSLKNEQKEIVTSEENDDYDAIEKLKRLLNMKAITNDEFEMKKAELLSRI